MSFAALYSLGTVGLAGDVKVKQKKNEYVNNHKKWDNSKEAQGRRGKQRKGKY